MKKKLCLLVFLIPFLSPGQGFQGSWPGKFFPGYSKSITTGKFSYHSPLPDVTESLLLRSIDSASYISWETSAIPTDFNEPYANFIWMFGIDANPESHTYRLFLNGEYCLTFANPLISEIKPWTVNGRNDVSLTFLTTMLDKYDDPMGYAVLKLPLAMIRRGAPQVIKIVGESAGSNVWYMTFESSVQEKLDIVQEDAILKNAGKRYYPVLFNFVHLGTSADGKLSIPGIQDRSFRLQPGFNRIQVLFPVSKDTANYSVTIKIGLKPAYEKQFRLHPVREWTIYLVEHAHTDIGYTRPQTEILPEHMRYIDYALDYCDQTDSLPDDARFRWTCETSWALQEYVKTRPGAQIERLRKRVAEGRIELTGLFLNSSDLSDETTIASYLQPIKQFRDAGIPITTAMQDDINGVPWCLVDYLAGCGIRYLNMGQNDSRALKPFDHPTTFWWISPSGNKILVNRPEHYMFGNTLGILTNPETFGNALFQHLSDISRKGYPYDHYAIQFSGYLTDNSPPSTTACRLVEKWNNTYEWPRLRLATISEFGKYMEKNHSSDIPSWRGAWPDWWMDGFGSAALETAYTRKSHTEYIANQGLMALAMIMHCTIPGHLTDLSREISEDLAFYDEHTFGAAESISDPLVENSIVQWNEKASYAWEAVKKNRILEEEIFGLIQDKLPKLNLPTVTVFNTLAWPRSGLVKVYIDHQLLPPGRSFSIVDEFGNAIPVQQLDSREEGTWWALYIKDLRPMGYGSYRIKVGNDRRVEEKPVFSGILENEFYKLRINPENGTVESLFDKQLQKELTDAKAPYSLGQFIYETLGKNRHQLEVLKLDEVRRMIPGNIKVSATLTDGPVWQSLILHGEIPGCADNDGISFEIRLYKPEKKIEFLYSMKKLAVTDPEGGYVAFPFILAGGHLEFEVQGGKVIPGKDQLAGSASDWDGVQNFVSVKNDDAQIVFVSPETPLVQLGAINLGKFSRIAKPESNSIYSWVFNNYWTTNFRAFQEGELKWTYQLTSSSDTSNQFATQFGWNDRIPILARVFPALGKDTNTFRRSFIELQPDLLLVNARPSVDKTGIILQVREIAGRNSSIPWHDGLSSQASFNITPPPKSLIEVNVLEEKIKEVEKNVEFKPFETKFIELILP